ncbi:hypothetical protein CAPTEDRAFT_163902 [Capitella teleta]|uniref:Elongation factor Ts, mitochondrial n=1 Tax=Capitella teleta TaxID=283909 RepID=R7TMI6_CAPTE|nr:hypothetical protein CAPTEDRAFT_163902 [Capitella teleta]|eukprot:ELT92766.1 hypothetical protein CAPTEDRAFT_163902 [Capitella teleta]
MLLRLLVTRAKDISGSLRSSCNLFHTAAIYQAAEKSPLVKLRKKTGFPVGKCKDALSKFNNNFQEAEQWLRKEAQREGWAKATKLQGRPMSQGLVVLKVEGNQGVIVEVNCETDFVAKNDKFQGLATKIANACLHQGASTNDSKIAYDKDSLAKVAVDDSTVADATALVLGNIGENMLARRAVYMRAGERESISYYVHAAMTPTVDDTKFLAGKYGAMVLTEKTGDPVDPTSDLKEIGRSLCLHVVGMNPKSVGSLKDLESSDSSSSESSSSESSDDEEEEDDSVMLKQKFVMDESLRVADVLQASGLTLKDFARFECGEVLEGDNAD